jgi:hypothetical protein
MLDLSCKMLALYFMHYNFARIHQSFRVIPELDETVGGHIARLVNHKASWKIP